MSVATQALIPVADVTSWPREGVTLLIVMAVLFVVAAVWVNRQGSPTMANETTANVIGPPESQPAGEAAPDTSDQAALDMTEPLDEEPLRDI